jgi:hypothetical protein
MGAHHPAQILGVASPVRRAGRPTRDPGVRLSGHVLGDALVFAASSVGVFTVFGKKVADEVGRKP